MLDQAELRHLALNASARNDDGTAIAYLKEAVSRPDADGIAHYLLGIHYAQAKMHEHATGELEAALALDPGLAIARFQLGLLWLGSGFADQSLAVLEPLQALPETDALRVFGQGLRHLAKDELIAAGATLARGIELNQANPALNADMRMMIDAIEQARAAARTDSAATDPVAADDSAYERHVLMSVYGTPSR